MLQSLGTDYCIVVKEKVYHESKKEGEFDTRLLEKVRIQSQALFYLLFFLVVWAVFKTNFFTNVLLLLLSEVNITEQTKKKVI